MAQTTQSRAKVCPLKAKSLKLIFNAFIQKIPKKFQKITMAPMGKIKQFLNGYNFGCV